MAASKVKVARKIRKAIAAYLLVSALYAVAEISTGSTEKPGNVMSMALVAAFLGATFAGGAGLLLRRNWGYWTAVAVLALQLVKIQIDGFNYDMLSLVGIYVYAGGQFSVGISAALDPRIDISSATSASWWFGVNVFAALLIASLFSTWRTDK